MKSILKKLTPRFVVALLTFTTGVVIALLWVAFHFRSVNTPSILEVSKITKNEEVFVPEGWKKLEVACKVISQRKLVVKDEITLQVPPGMEPRKPSGDSPSYREAYSNGDIYITIVYSESDSCATSPYFLAQSTYHESLTDIGGRKVKLGIAPYFQPKNSMASVCFLTTNDSAMQLRVSVFCKDERALETAQLILKSIRFKDTR